MEAKSKAGVHFNCKKSKKFKSIVITIDFVEPLSDNNLEQRTMVAEMLENYSHKYNSKLKVAQKLAKMYGAQFGTNVFKIGEMAVLRIFISFVNDEYLPNNTDLTQQIAEFLHEMIFNPYFVADQYPDQIFKLHQQNLINYLQNLDDNKKYYAAKELRKLYFADNPQNAKLIFGDAHRLQKVNSKDTADYYRWMLDHNEIFVSILGNLSSSQLKKIQQQLKFKPRKATASSIIKLQNSSKLKEKTEVVQQQQSILNLAYEIPVSIMNLDYYAVLIMNAILGGSPLSLMFTNIREKQSLAYYINSSYKSTLGYLTIQSGIDGANYHQVRKMIAKQIESIIQMKYSDDLLKKIKLLMISDYLTKYDSERQILNNIFIESILQQTITKDKWINNINKISKKDIAKVARMLKLKAVFFLKGENNA